MQKIVAGNWKMNPSSAKEAEMIFKGTVSVAKASRRVKIIVFPPFLYINRLKKISGKVGLGGQDASWSLDGGAYTSQISAEMLYDSGARYVILGHSEKRYPPVPPKFSEDESIEGDSNEVINQKVKVSLKAGLSLVLCVGERSRDERHKYLNFTKNQVLECLSGVSRSSFSKVILAYEPVWAIGKSALREATPEEFLEMKIFLKRVLADRFGVASAERVKILYGGSVNPKNAEGFLKEGEADGFLVGRDSLKPNKFAGIIKAAEEEG